MAAVGFTPISLYYSSTPAAVPNGANLVAGELALNTSDGKLYFKNASNVVTLLASSSGASGDVVGPGSATDNAAVRFDGTTGKLVQNSAVTIADTSGDISAGAYNKVTITAPASSATLTIADGKTLTMNNSITFSGTDATTMTFPGTTTTVVGTDVTQTLTNKRINPRAVAAGATSGNLTINGDTTDVYVAEGLTGAITFLQPSGTPVDGQRLIIRIEDDGTARGITWTTTSGAFRAVGITLPTTTVLSKVTYVGCIYNSTDIFWDVVATVTQA